jgi:hypothetical protein
MLLVGVLVASVVVPYVLLDKNLSQTARTQLNRLLGKSEAASGDNPLADLKLPFAPAQGEIAASPAAASAAAPLPVTLEEAFRFDVTPQWVTARWPRVSTLLGEPEQLGMRVALASGTRPDDVAGSLTYYFDEHHQLQRITFYGLTGNEQRLLGFLVHNYRLKSAPTTGVARYIAGPADKPTSSVTVRHLPVVRADAAHAQVELAVDLRRSETISRGGIVDPAPVALPASYRPW